MASLWGPPSFQISRLVGLINTFGHDMARVQWKAVCVPGYSVIYVAPLPAFALRRPQRWVVAIDCPPPPRQSEDFNALRRLADFYQLPVACRIHLTGSTLVSELSVSNVSPQCLEAQETLNVGWIWLPS